MIICNKKDNIFFNYVNIDYIKYDDKIIDNRIDISLIYFNDIKLLKYIVKYLSNVCDYEANKT